MLMTIREVNEKLCHIDQAIETIKHNINLNSFRGQVTLEDAIDLLYEYRTMILDTTVDI